MNVLQTALSLKKSEEFWATCWDHSRIETDVVGTERKKLVGSSPRLIKIATGTCTFDVHGSWEDLERGFGVP